MTTITSDALVKAILSIRERGTLPETIARATGGAAIGDKILAKVESALNERVVDANGADPKTRPQRAAWAASIMLMLRASPGLPEVLTEASALFPKENAKPRKGGKMTAIKAGCQARLEGRNDWAAVMANAVPFLSDDDARTRDLKTMRTALENLAKEASRLGCPAEVNAKLTALIALVK
jgi:hypothetical protein